MDGATSPEWSQAAVHIIAFWNVAAAGLHPEAVVMDWRCRLFNFPAISRFVFHPVFLTPGATMATHKKYGRFSGKLGTGVTSGANAVPQ